MSSYLASHPQEGLRAGEIRPRLSRGLDEEERTEEAALPLSQDQQQPYHAWPEAADGAPGQATLPQNHIRPSLLRSQVFLYEHEGERVRERSERASES